MLIEGTEDSLIRAFCNLAAAQYHDINARKATKFLAVALSNQTLYPISIHGAPRILFGDC